MRLVKIVALSVLLLLFAGGPAHGEPITISGGFFAVGISEPADLFRGFAGSDLEIWHFGMLQSSATCSPCVPGEVVNLSERDRSTAEGFDPVFGRVNIGGEMVFYNDGIMEFEIDAGNVTLTDGNISTRTRFTFLARLTGSINGLQFERALRGRGDD